MGRLLFRCPGARHGNQCSFVAKTIHLIAPTMLRRPVALPTGRYPTYTRNSTAETNRVREGNYGLMLKGDPDILIPTTLPAGIQRVSSAAHDGRDSRSHKRRAHQRRGQRGRYACADGKALQLLVYNHVDGGQADPLASSLVSVQLAISHLPLQDPCATLSGRSHASNAYDILPRWAGRRSPRDRNGQNSAARASFVITRPRFPERWAWSVTFPQNTYSVFFVLIDSAAREPGQSPP